MTPRQAVLATAELIEQRPEMYDFHRVGVPDCGSPGCALGWIGHFSELPVGTSVGAGRLALCVAKEVLGCQPDEGGYFATEFYDRLDSLIGTAQWRFAAALAAKALRLYADKYLPERDGIPDAVRAIFTGAITQEPQP